MIDNCFVYHGCTIHHNCSSYNPLYRRDKQSETSYIRNLLIHYFPKQEVEPERPYEWYNLSSKAYSKFIYRGVVSFLNRE